MTRELYEAYNPKPETARLISQAGRIIEEYQGQGLRLTLRQLYYQLVSRDVIPNKDEVYEKLSMVVSRARRGGFLDWDALEDRLRMPRKPPEFDSLSDLVEAAVSSYRLPRMKGQETYVELWVEKDALAGVLAPIGRARHVTMMVNRGYSSTSAMKEAGARVRAACREIGADHAVVLYLGDLDPSGEDMVRDVGERLKEYTNQGILVFHEEDAGGEIDIKLEEDGDRAKRLRPKIWVEVKKLALTMEQVEEYQPPPNPAKLSDSRAKKFVEQHGYESWEVDALPPTVLRDIIESSLDEIIDQEKVDEIIEQESRDKVRLREAVLNLHGPKLMPEPVKPTKSKKPTKKKGK